MKPTKKSHTQRSKATRRTMKKPVKKIAPPLRKSTSIIRNDYNDEHIVARKGWHAEICNRNIPAADILSILIDLYDEDPDSVTDGEIYMDDWYFNYCLWHDHEGKHDYGALLTYLESLGLITFRRCYENKCQHAASGRMYYIKLQVGAIEEWLHDVIGWEVQAQTL
jgi:hypothetical protein